MSEKKKINWLLILQGWAMLWVVMGHSFLVPMEEGPRWVLLLYKAAQPFRMPLFMLVSGWLTYLTRIKANELSGGNKWPYFKLIREKVERLLLPGLVFSLLAFAVKLALPNEMSRQVVLNFKEITHAFIYPNDNPFRELWFIATIFWFFLFTPLWSIVIRKTKIMWGMVAVLIVIHYLSPNVELLCIGRALKFAIWFYLGLVICKADIVEKLFNRNPWLTILFGIIIYTIGWFTDALITTGGGDFIFIWYSFIGRSIFTKYLLFFPKLYLSNFFNGYFCPDGY